LRAGLCDAGYVEGNTFKLEGRWAHGTPEMLRQFAQDLVQLRVDLVVASPLFVEDVARRRGNERENACAKASDEGFELH
jgi:hypothetical protein